MSEDHCAGQPDPVHLLLQSSSHLRSSKKSLFGSPCNIVSLPHEIFRFGLAVNECYAEHLSLLGVVWTNRRKRVTPILIRATLNKTIRVKTSVSSMRSGQRLVTALHFASGKQSAILLRQLR